jgi:hypothetical protein
LEEKKRKRWGWKQRKNKMKRSPRGGGAEKKEGKKHLLISPTYVGPIGSLQKTSSPPKKK